MPFLCQVRKQAFLGLLAAQCIILMAILVQMSTGMLAGGAGGITNVRSKWQRESASP
jgi:hypothetical protein